MMFLRIKGQLKMDLTFIINYDSEKYQNRLNHFVIAISNSINCIFFTNSNR